MNEYYIWQDKDWPCWQYDLAVLAQPLSEVSLAQGHLIGRLADVGMSLRDQASLIKLTEEVVKTSEIEGEHLNVESVRSSIARRLGVDIGASVPADRNVEGVVDMVLDASLNCNEPLTQERLFGWHAALFPSTYSGLHKINVGAWRLDTNGPMQVVSGPVGKQKIHFEAPAANRLELETQRFLDWFNCTSHEAPLLKAGLAHLWLVSLHPFDDGNGRIARAVGDLLLARSDGSVQRFYSLSGQIQLDRKSYYEILERTQKKSMDVTEWLIWFLQALKQAISRANQTLDMVLRKANFWHKNSHQIFNIRQIKLLNKLLDGFEGKLNSSKWSAIARCSTDSALRDINDLIAKDILIKTNSGGRSTSYELKQMFEQ